jgi:hypothetical protein
MKVKEESSPQAITAETLSQWCKTDDWVLEVPMERLVLRRKYQPILYATPSILE